MPRGFQKEADVPDPSANAPVTDPATATESPTDRIKQPRGHKNS